MHSTQDSVKPFLYLASQSPRRAQLLDQLGIGHRLLLADCSEDVESLEEVLQGETATDYVQRVTALKLTAALKRLDAHLLRQAGKAQSFDLKASPSASQGYTLAPILCADTTVALGDQILGKPNSVDDAHRILTLLSGQTHQVLTAVTVSWGALEHDEGEPFLRALSVSCVEFAALSSDEINAYVQTGEPMGKAGAYAVQGRAAGFIKNIQGSYSGIMGLPLYECAQLIKQLGL